MPLLLIVRVRPHRSLLAGGSQPLRATPLRFASKPQARASSPIAVNLLALPSPNRRRGILSFFGFSVRFLLARQLATMRRAKPNF